MTKFIKRLRDWLQGGRVAEATPSVLELPKDATLVLCVPGMLTQEVHERMSKQARTAFNHPRVVILENGISLQVVANVDGVACEEGEGEKAR